jgi:hypothetical protein
LTVIIPTKMIKELRQIYVYNDCLKYSKPMLICILTRTTFTKEDLISFDKTTAITNHACGLGKNFIFESDNITLNKEIRNTILEWFKII